MAVPGSPASPAPPVDPALLDAAVAIARAAGDLTLQWFRSADLQTEWKRDGTPVTVADRAAEALVRREVAARFPGDAIVGEEEGGTAARQGRTWFVDPIDGTKAFTHGVPLYSTLVAVSDDHGPAVGVIHLPALGETVYAGRGRGCHSNGAPARVAAREDLEGAFLMTSGMAEWRPDRLGRLQAAGVHVRTWGDGYGYALVATGRADAMFDPAVSVWDVAPMPVILAEAGGRFTDLDGVARADGGSGLATAGPLHDELLALLRPV